MTYGTLKDPYQGMVVSVKGEPGLWILVGEDPSDKNSWTTVSGSGISEDVEKALSTFFCGGVSIIDDKLQVTVTFAGPGYGSTVE